jgi:kynureninase
MTRTLLDYRAEFPILETCTYLISNSLGAMPRAVYDKLKDYADTWATLGVRAWGSSYQDNPTWWELKGAVGDKIAPLMGAPRNSVLVHENASVANSILLGALDWSDTRRHKVVVTDQDFPSDTYSLKAMLPPHIQVTTIRSHDGITIDTQEILDAIDEHTRLVSISHVLFRSAYIMPAQAIIEKAHRVGAQVLLNGYHSVGIIPVDVTALNVDFYIGGTLKWLCGGSGGVFMYVRPDLLPSLTPKITGWVAHQTPFMFSEDFVLREDAYRLANGTPAIVSYYAIQPGVEIIAQVGVEAIRANSIRLTSMLLEMADTAQYTVNSPRHSADRAGTLTIQPPHAYEISRELLARNIVIDYREGAGIRIAPHFYNTDEEVRSVMHHIAEILADNSWQRHTQREFVT